MSTAPDRPPSWASIAIGPISPSTCLRPRPLSRTGLAELGQFQELRQVAALLDAPDAAILAHARAMAYWHQRHRFCGDCGSPTESREGGYVRVCSNAQCGQHHFPRSDPAIIVLVESGNRCLLGRKSSWPAGQYSTIAGFVEPGECIEGAVIREVSEETGVQVGEIHYQSSQPWPFPSSLMLGFRARAVESTIRVDQDELRREDAQWFTREEHPVRAAGKAPPAAAQHLCVPPPD